MRPREEKGEQVDDPALGAPQRERLRAIRFQVMPSQELQDFSVFDSESRHLERAKDLHDPRLGLPCGSGERHCLTCRADSTRDCEGHFGHISLPEKIYHPLFVAALIRVLRAVCFRCNRSRLRRKKKLQLEAPEFDAWLPELQEQSHAGSDSGSQLRSPSPLELPKCGGRPIRGGGGFKSGVRKKRRALAPAGPAKRRRRSRLYQQQEEEGLEVGVEVETDAEDLEPGEDEDGESQDEQQDDDLAGGRRGTAVEQEEEACKFCSSRGNALYPELNFKLSPRDCRGTPVDLIQMVAGRTKDEDGCLPPELAPDYWDFLGGPINKTTDDDPLTSRYLLPREAHKLLKALPEDVMKEVRKATGVADPASLILSCVPVPPNCTRVVERFGSTMIAPLENDPATKKLTQLLKEVRDIRENSAGRTFFRSLNDYTRLQLAYVRYLRASKMKEEPEKKPDGTLQKGRAASGKLWMKNVVFGKFSDFCFRGAVTGDPSLLIQEIGIPFTIASTVTVPEVVTLFNQQRLQGYVHNGSVRGMHETGATWVVRNDVKYTLSQYEGRFEVEVGDLVHRHLQDGDLVVANRPPSAHKHSLIALRAVLHSSTAIGLNPLICTPFGADFDGDCFSVFVPQSLPSTVECHELMTVEQQLINPQCGQPIVSLTQDTLLGAHLLVQGDVFLTRDYVGTFAMLGSSKVPIPAIVKSPQGSRWTGKQVFSMTLPPTLKYQGGGVYILHGEILDSDGGSPWLNKSATGVVKAIYNEAGPPVTLSHLNAIQAMSNWWLSQRGFSVGLSDFMVALDSTRKTMLKEIGDQLDMAITNASREQLMSDPFVPRSTRNLNVKSDDATFTKRSADKVKALQSLGVAKFQSLFSRRIEYVIMRYIRPDNSLLAMVRAGSKGSMGKLLQQAGCLGLHLHKGNEVLPYRLGAPFTTEGQSLRFGVEDLPGHWEASGLIRRALVDGLRPKEFFVQAMCSRSSAPSYGLELPNKIFKSLMLFMRDMYLAYDGSVRHRLAQQVIQLRFGRAPEDLAQGASTEGPEKSLDNPAMAGEAVGALAATSLAEPAYNFVLGSSQAAGKMDPLGLLRETFFTRATAPLKEVDRLVTLRLAKKVRTVVKSHSAALQIQEFLKIMHLTSLLRRCVIEYRPVEACPVEEDLDLTPTDDVHTGPTPHRTSPYLGHMQLSGEDMERCDLNLEMIAQRVRRRLDTIPKAIQFSKVEVVPCHPCTSAITLSNPHPLSTTEPCLHVFHHLMDDTSDEKAQENLEILRDKVFPAVMETVVRGDERIESVKIRCEDYICRTQVPDDSITDDEKDVDFGGGLVLDVVVKSHYKVGKLKKRTARGQPWQIVTDACMMVADLIDWKRSMPGSIQEIRHNLGVSAARSCILQRLTLATSTMNSVMDRKLLKLIADTMVHTGNVLGMNSPGYQDFLMYYKLTAPFTQATDQEPLRKFAQASVRGDTENLSSVVTSAVWGKEVQLGTGADMEIIWKDHQADKAEFNMDVHEFLSFFADMSGAEQIPSTPSSQYLSAPSDNGTEMWVSDMQDEAVSTPYPLRPGVCPTSSKPSPAPILPASNPVIPPVNIVSSSRSEFPLHSPDVRSDTLMKPPSSNPVVLQAAAQAEPNLLKRLTSRQADCLHSTYTRRHTTQVEPSLPSPLSAGPAGRPGTQVDPRLPKPLSAGSQLARPITKGEPNLPSDAQVQPSQLIPPSSLSADHFHPLQPRWASPGRRAMRPYSMAGLPSRRSPPPENRRPKLPRRLNADRNYGGAMAEGESLGDTNKWITRVLHGGYREGEKLTGYDQAYLLSDVLKFHPNETEKIGPGVKFVEFGFHPQHKSPCLFLVRLDGSRVDVSLRKCERERIKRECPQKLHNFDKQYFSGGGR